MEAYEKIGLNQLERLYSEAWKLKREGQPLSRICNLLGLKIDCVRDWFYKGVKPKNQLLCSPKNPQNQFSGAWTDQEKQTLKRTHPNGEKRTIITSLPNRTRSAIFTKARRMNIRRNKYSFKEAPPLKLEDWQKGYIAGILDGEGHISLITYQKQIDPIVAITNTSSHMIKTLRHIIGFGKIRKQRPGKKDWKTLWRLEFRTFNEIITLLTEIKDYLITKKRQAKLMIQYCKRRIIALNKNPIRRTPYSEKEIQIATIMRELNTKGIPHGIL